MFGSLMNPPLPMVEMLSGDELRHADLTSVPFLWRVKGHESARWIYQRLVVNSSFDELGASGRHVRFDLKHLTNMVRNEMRACVFDSDTELFRLSVHDIMTATLPLLDEAEGLALVDAVASTTCAAQKEKRTQRLLDLYRAVASRDADTMSAMALRVLADDAEIPQPLHGYTVTAGMLGDLAAGRPQDAREIWGRHAEKAFGSRQLPVHVELISNMALDSATPSAQLSDAH